MNKKCSHSQLIASLVFFFSTMLKLLPTQHHHQQQQRLMTTPWWQSTGNKCFSIATTVITNTAVEEESNFVEFNYKMLSLSSAAVCGLGRRLCCRSGVSQPTTTLLLKSAKFLITFSRFYIFLIIDLIRIYMLCFCAVWELLLLVFLCIFGRCLFEYFIFFTSFRHYFS